MKTGNQVKRRRFLALGRYLARLRVEAGLTQHHVARKLRYSSPQFVSNFERGIARPPLRKLKTLIDIYGADANEVIDLIVRDHQAFLKQHLVEKGKRT